MARRVAGRGDHLKRADALARHDRARGRGGRARIAASQLPLRLAGIERTIRRLAQQAGIALGDDHLGLRQGSAERIERADVVAVGVREHDPPDRPPGARGGVEDQPGAARHHCVHERVAVVLCNQVGVDEPQASDARDASHRLCLLSRSAAWEPPPVQPGPVRTRHSVPRDSAATLSSMASAIQEIGGTGRMTERCRRRAHNGLPTWRTICAAWARNCTSAQRPSSAASPLARANRGRCSTRSWRTASSGSGASRRSRWRAGWRARAWRWRARSAGKPGRSSASWPPTARRR